MRCLAIRDVIDFTAKSVKSVHGFPALRREEMHYPGERAFNGGRAQLNLGQRNRVAPLVDRAGCRPAARALRCGRIEKFDRIHCNLFAIAVVTSRWRSSLAQGRVAYSRPGMVCSGTVQRLRLSLSAPQRWGDRLLASISKSVRLLL